MRKLVLFTFAVCLMFLAPVTAVAGDTFTGTLIDADCRTSEATAKCDVTEETKSFALVAANGETIRLDAAGNQKVSAALASSPSKAGEKKAMITGQLKDGALSVESVRIL